MLRARAKDCAADTNMGCTMRNGRFVVRAHAHTQARNAITPGNACQHIEMADRIIRGRRNTHQAANRQTELTLTLANKPVRICRQHARLLRFCASVDLHKHLRRAALPVKLLRQHARQFGPVQRMNGIKQPHRLPRLVGLQRADEMNLCIVILLAQQWPFADRFLHAVFSKHPRPGVKHRHNIISGKCLADRNKGHIIRGAASALRGFSHPFTDGFQAVGSTMGSDFAHDAGQ